MKQDMKNELMLEGARQRLIDLEKQRLEIYKAFPQLTPAQAEQKLRKKLDEAAKAKIVAYAKEHGATAAAKKYELNVSTVYGWSKK